ncbi:MAG: 50S ribosomal protein L5 [Candidatus Pacebacteria bacterium]|nr:50S ribosomal protein L5 [Candidatus Paceibacterota bacterium]MDD3072142.1 50S ribosomal protein L5 [Candidatus Paceibacterota bacterium]MDD4201348.1 50S ribosomal protein L5 [Candidatus Paceibacterota bacterium]MDD4897161.1 50S ribosomal protein L5 [Candidatus Paceibacterota bacterium]MDD5445643.1 50S ribosomal protein L5 [Candidatus Paceibacterota bacterium]
MSRLKEKYEKKVIPAMMEKFGYKNKFSVPKMEKVVLNVGFGKIASGKASAEQKKIEEAVLEDLGLISGQRPYLANAKKSVAAFKLRKGTPVGAAVVLRKKKMYDFVDRFISISLPRMRDFAGIKKESFDKSGNLTIGIREHIIFPEILPEKTKSIFGMEVTIATTSKNKEEGIEMLRLIGFPIKK